MAPMEHPQDSGRSFSPHAKPRINTQESTLDNTRVLKTLNRIMEFELAGVVRYTHYALMVYGYNRIPIVAWLESQAAESLVHARQAGELVTCLGGHPSLSIGPLLESHQHDMGDILRESLAHEGETLKAYEELLSLVRDKNVRLEEYARDMISAEMAHQDEVNKMLRKPGQTEVYSTP
jgi:bacterioferritin